MREVKGSKPKGEGATNVYRRVGSDRWFLNSQPIGFWISHPQQPTPSSVLLYTFWGRSSSPNLLASNSKSDPSDLANSGKATFDNTRCFVGAAVSNVQEARCQVNQYIDQGT